MAAITICGKCEAEWLTDSGRTVCPTCGNDGTIEGHAFRRDADIAVVVTLLNAAGIRASHEYPGFINIDEPGLLSWAFGDANGTWDGDLMTTGGQVVDGVHLAVGSDAGEQVIADAIAGVIRSLWCSCGHRRHQHTPDGKQCGVSLKSGAAPQSAPYTPCRCTGFSSEPDERVRVMRNLPVRRVSIECIDHPEWGTWGVYEDCGGYYVIHGNSGSRVLDKSEAEKFWRVVP